MGKNRKVIYSFIIFLFALGLALPGYFLIKPAEREESDTEEIYRETEFPKESNGKEDRQKELLETIRWSVAFYGKKAGAAAERGIKNARSSLEKAAEEIVLEPYAEAYYKVLKEKSESNPYTDYFSIGFRLVYIDGDEIPELLVFTDYIHASGVGVYTYHDGGIVDLGEFGSFGGMSYAEKKGLIHGGFYNSGEGISYYYKLEKGALELICQLHYAEHVPLYEIDGVSVSEEAFGAKGKEMNRDEYIVMEYKDGIFAEDILELKMLLAQEARKLVH